MVLLVVVDPGQAKLKILQELASCIDHELRGWQVGVACSKGGRGKDKGGLRS